MTEKKPEQEILSSKEVAQEIAKAQPKPRLIAKLAKIMGDLDPIAKTGRNAAQNYSFIEQGQVVAAIRPHLAKNNIMIIPEIVDKTVERYTYEDSAGKERNSVQALVKSKYTIIDGDTGESFECEWAGEANDTGDKALNKAATASNKYFLIKLFNISDKDDADHDSIPAPPSDTPSDKQKGMLRGLMMENELVGEKAFEFSQSVIGKKQPETKRDYSDLIEAAMKMKEKASTK